MRRAGLFMGRLCKRMCGRSCGAMLLVCLTLGVLWAASYRAKAILRLPVSTGSTRFEFYSYRGLLAFATIADFPADQRVETCLLDTDPAREARWDTLYWSDSWAGFSGEEGRIWVRGLDGQMVTRRWFNVMIPYWMIIALCLLAPLRDAY